MPKRPHKHNVLPIAPTAPSSLRAPRKAPNTRRPTPTTTLLQKLATIQESGGHSDRTFARMLGITNGHWSRVRGGLSTMGPKTLHSVTHLYPDLEPDVLAYIRAEKTNR